MLLKRLVLSIIIPYIAGGIGSLATFDAIRTWYATLHKPFFNPPNFIFGPVWTLLYLLQGIALYLFWNSKGEGKKARGFQLFGIQLVLNAFWSIIFFGLKMPIFAFGEVIVLWIFILLTLHEFKKFDKTAGYLLYPYLVWVGFAAILNLFIVILN